MKKLFTIILGSAMLLLGNSCVVHTRPAHAHTVVIKKAPKHHKVVLIKGHKYYTWNGKHYRKTNRGYVFVRI